MIVYDIPSSQWCSSTAPDVSVSELQQIMIGLITQHGSNIREVMVGNTSAAEMASWSIKVMEARAFTASQNPADAPMLQIEASTRGVPLDALTQRVFANSQALTTMEAVVAGVVGKHSDVVKSIQDYTTLANYDWSTDWPMQP